MHVQEDELFRIPDARKREECVAVYRSFGVTIPPRAGAWDVYFEIPAYAALAGLQAVIDRIEPGWMTDIRALPPIMRN